MEEKRIVRYIKQNETWRGQINNVRDCYLYIYKYTVNWVLLARKISTEHVLFELIIYSAI